jgi:CubicO group peptidase (beta-lactamase class C family)
MGFVHDNIFKPLGMNDSGMDSNFTVIPRRVSGYSPGENGIDNEEAHLSLRLPGWRTLFLDGRHALVRRRTVWRQAVLDTEVP